jgi:NADH:ubiquinone oxidoreductase subunit C
LQLPDITVVRGLLARAGLSATVEGVEHLGVVCRVPAAEARESVVALRDSDFAFGFLVDVFGIDTGSEVDVVYRLRSLTRDEEIVVNAAHTYDAVLRSVWDVFPAALMPERELCELFGLRLLGHPNPKRLLTTDGCAPYLRKDVEVRGSEEVRDRAQQVVDSSRPGRTAGRLTDATASGDDCPPVGALDGDAAGGANEWPLPSTLPADLKRVPCGVDLDRAEHLTINMGPQHP